MTADISNDCIFLRELHMGKAGSGCVGVLADTVSGVTQVEKAIL